VNTIMISERGHVSALSACPLTAAASQYPIAGPRLTAPIQNGPAAEVRPQAAAAPKPITVTGASVLSGMRASLVVDGRFGVVTAIQQLDQSVQQFDPNDPGALTRRPPA